MNNILLGNAFEAEMCKELADAGYWVHFINPDKRGAQPFDIIAVKSDMPIAIDCKTSARRIFSFDRLEDNQKLAFDKWQRICANHHAIIAVKYKDSILWVPYLALKEKGKIDLEKDDAIYRWK